jgi:hypothetical protein
LLKPGQEPGFIECVGWEDVHQLWSYAHFLCCLQFWAAASIGGSGLQMGALFFRENKSLRSNIFSLQKNTPIRSPWHVSVVAALTDGFAAVGDNGLAGYVGAGFG